MDSVRSLHWKVHTTATTMLTDGTIISIAPDFVEADQALSTWKLPILCIDAGRLGGKCMRFVDSDVVPVLLFGPIGSISSLAGNKCRTDGFSAFSSLEGAHH